LEGKALQREIPPVTVTELSSYGSLFFLVGLESMGVPLPGETALVTAAAVAATGRLSIYGVVLTAALAAILGDNGGYWIGRKGGMGLVHRYGGVLHLDESKLARVHAFFERHGPKAVFLGRFTALLRTWVAVLAGVADMPYGIFMLYNALGGILWALTFGTAGYLFGQNLPRLEHDIGRASLALALLVALTVGLVLGLRWFRANSAILAGRVRQSATRAGASRALQLLRRIYPRAWSLVVARFEPGEYLGLHLTLGLLASLAGLWVFAGVTEDVVHHDPLTRFDLVVLEWFHAHRTPLGLALAEGISWLGSPLLLCVLGLVVAVMLAVNRSWLTLAAWGAALGGTRILGMVLKVAVQRPRPEPGPSLLHGEGFSFPSGHAMGSLVAYGMLAYLLLAFWVKRRVIRMGVVAVLSVLVVAIGLSRLYLGTHCFSEVIGGYAAGLLWLSACITGLEIARRQRGTARSSQRGSR
jgi:membrane protein DedA with SNARE-associated domain/membrane-associated phospholipid phosphatase